MALRSVCGCKCKADNFRKGTAAQVWAAVSVGRHAMIDLYFVTSPNVTKVVIALEEMGLDYRLRPTELSKGEHLDPANVAGAINGKLPVIRDNIPAGGGDAVTIFESGAILQYLAEKSG